MGIETGNEGPSIKNYFSRKTEIPTDAWKVNFVSFPLQENSRDCGSMICLYARGRINQAGTLAFSSSDVVSLKQQLISEFERVEPCEVETSRQHLVAEDDEVTVLNKPNSEVEMLKNFGGINDFVPTAKKYDARVLLAKNKSLRNLPDSEPRSGSVRPIGCDDDKYYSPYSRLSKLSLKLQSSDKSTVFMKHARESNAPLNSSESEKTGEVSELHGSDSVNDTSSFPERFHSQAMKNIFDDDVSDDDGGVDTKRVAITTNDKNRGGNDDDFEWIPVENLRVQIYWKKESKFYEGKVCRWSKSRSKWKINYDDGDVRFHVFDPNKWKIASGNKKRVLQAARKMRRPARLLWVFGRC